MKVGDIVIPSAAYPEYHSNPGMVVETMINMWGEEVNPSGVKILWGSGEIENVYADEIELINIHQLTFRYR